MYNQVHFRSLLLSRFVFVWAEQQVLAGAQHVHPAYSFAHRYVQVLLGINAKSDYW